MGIPKHSSLGYISINRKNSAAKVRFFSLERYKKPVILFALSSSDCRLISLIVR